MDILVRVSVAVDERALFRPSRCSSIPGIRPLSLPLPLLLLPPYVPICGEGAGAKASSIGLYGAAAAALPPGADELAPEAVRRPASYGAPMRGGGGAAVT